MSKNNKKPELKKTIIVGMIIIAIVALLIAPFAINCAYMLGTKDGKANIAFSASDMISLYGNILAFIGTVSLGGIACWQNIKMHKLNERMAKIEENREKPIFAVLWSGGSSDITFTVTNVSNSPALYINYSSLHAVPENEQPEDYELRENRKKLFLLPHEENQISYKNPWSDYPKSSHIGLIITISASDSIGKQWKTTVNVQMERRKDGVCVPKAYKYNQEELHNEQ